MNPCKYEIPSGSTYGFLIADDAAQACPPEREGGRKKRGREEEREGERGGSTYGFLIADDAAQACPRAAARRRARVQWRMASGLAFVCIHEI